MAKEYEWAVYMGRFQPFHSGHMRVVQKAFEIADNVLILIGGEKSCRSAKNPFTFLERAHMISKTVTGDESYHLSITGIKDHPYSDEDWVEEVKGKVGWHLRNSTGKVALVGHEKDASSYYLKLFPEWTFVDMGNYQNIDATTIRDIYFSHPHLNILDSGIPTATRDLLRKFTITPQYKDLVAEHAFIKNYKKSWSMSPYPPVFVTVDIAVMCDDRLLTIVRGNYPGKGLIALPGGFSEVNETLEKSAMRELQEETGVAMSTKEFRDRLLDVRTFAHPNRSQIGRVITHMHTITADGMDLVPKAGDDAAKLDWLNEQTVNSLREGFASDHWFMAKHAFQVYKER